MSNIKSGKKAKLNLNDYLAGFNELLLLDGFKERFILEKYSHRQGENEIEYYALVLYNLKDRSKIIAFMDNSSVYPEGVLSWFDTHQHFDFIDYATNEWSDIQDNLVIVYEMIKEILQDEIIEIKQDDEIKRSCSFDIFMNPDLLKYGKKEKKYLSLPSVTFMNWSGKITENMKLFAIGFYLTDMPEIKKKRKEYLEINNQKPCIK